MKRSLSISLLWKISILIIASLLTLGYFSISKVRQHSRNTFVKDTSEIVDTLLTFVGNTNSVMMQQLRSYTMLDETGYMNPNPEDIQEMLISKAKRRYKFFSQIAYVQYSTGLAFRDNGEIDDVSQTPWFKTMKAQRKPKKGLQLYADIDVSFKGDKPVYPICKDAEPKDADGYCHGFFVGFVPISYMQVYFDKIKGRSWDAPEGFPILLNRAQQILCAPDTSYVMKNKFEGNDELEIDPDLIEFILNPKDVDENGKKIIVNGTVTWKGVSSTMVAGRLAGTEWTFAIVTPDSTIDESATILTKVIAAGGIIALFLILIVVTLIFRFSFKPLIELNNAFTGIASGDADLRTRLHEGKNDEIGQIQRSFNAYVAQLQDMIRDIGQAREDLISVQSTFDLTIKKIQKEFDLVADSSQIVKSESSLQNNYAGSLETVVTSSITNTEGTNRLLVEQSKLIKEASVASPEQLQKILVAMTGNLKEINEGLKAIHRNGKNNEDAVNSLRKSARNSISATEQLDKNILEIDETKIELQELIRRSYDAVNLISERVEGFRY